MVEGGRLESVYGSNVIGGSNPPSSDLGTKYYKLVLRYLISGVLPTVIKIKLLWNRRDPVDFIII